MLETTYCFRVDAVKLVLVTESQHGHDAVKTEDAVVRKIPACSPDKKVYAKKRSEAHLDKSSITVRRTMLSSLGEPVAW